MAKILTVYYSRKGENYFGGTIRSIKKGNTERVAEYIQKAVGGDLFELETVREYSADYKTCTEEAAAEKRSNARRISHIMPDEVYYYEGWNVLCLNYAEGDISPYTVSYIGKIHDTSFSEILKAAENELEIRIEG